MDYRRHAHSIHGFVMDLSLLSLYNCIMMKLMNALLLVMAAAIMCSCASTLNSHSDRWSDSQNAYMPAVGGHGTYGGW